MGPDDSPDGSPDGDFKRWPEGEESEVFSRDLTSSETSEVECELLLDSLELGGEVSPEFEGGEVLTCEVSDREVTPEHEGEKLSGWYSGEVSPNAEHGQLNGWSDVSGHAWGQQSRCSSRGAISGPPWGQQALPSSTEEPAGPVNYYTPQAPNPDFDYIPLHEKRPAVSEHDRNHAEADDWGIISSSEDVEPQLYTKFTLSDGTVIYRLPPYQTDLSDEVGTIGDPTSKHLDGFRVCCNLTEGGPPPCAEVHVVFEVSPDNKPHPKSWLGLPTTCLYEDSSRAETLALRIEWKNEKEEIESEYLRHTHSPLLFSTADEGQYDGLGLAIGILNHLENREIVQNKREFVREFGKARMLHIIVDAFLRKITLQEYLDSPQKIADAGTRSQDTIHEELLAAGAENINLPFGTFDGNENRARCDRCLVAHAIATGIAGSDRVAKMCSVADCNADCQLAPGTNRCIHCQQLGIDCTYTNDVLEKPALLRALWLAPLTGTETFSVVDPKLVNTINRDV
jgi:hypothetical protein